MRITVVFIMSCVFVVKFPQRGLHPSKSANLYKILHGVRIGDNGIYLTSPYIIQ